MRHDVLSVDLPVKVELISVKHELYLVEDIYHACVLSNNMGRVLDNHVQRCTTVSRRHEKAQKALA